MGGARFLLSGPRWDGLPAVAQLGAREFAFAGRSNVGKSSLLGAVLGSPRLVRTSRTPGRTQLINLFAAGPGAEGWVGADLPGYGYARLSAVQRRELGGMVAAYLRHREGLAAVVLLLDARRETLSPLDLEVLAATLRWQRQLLVVLTKADKVGRSMRAERGRALGRQLMAGGLAGAPAAAGDGRALALAPLFVSAHTGENIRLLRRLLDGWGRQAQQA